MISFKNFALRRGERLLLSEMDLALHAGWRTGVVGRNGTGKSSLFAAVRGEVEADKGDLDLPNRVRVASIAQELPSLPDPAIDFVLGGDAAVAAVLTTIAAFPFAWLAVRYRGALSRAVEGANFVTSSMPGIVTALALVTVAIRFAPPLYQTVSLVLGAYILMFLPRALVSLRSGLAQIPPGLEEASRSLGLSPTRSFLRVTLRLAAPAAGAGAALVAAVLGLWSWIQLFGL